MRLVDLKTRNGVFKFLVYGFGVRAGCGVTITGRLGHFVLAG